MAAAMSARWLRTVLVNARSLSVASSDAVRATGTAAEKTGVRSGAWRTSSAILPDRRASNASGQACEPVAAGSTKSSSGLRADQGS